MTTLTTSLALAIALAGSSAWADPITPAAASFTLLERDAAHAHLWWTGFMATYSSAAVVQTTLALVLEDPLLRPGQIVGAAAAWLGVAGLVLSPIPRVWRAAEEARRTGRVEQALAIAAEAEAGGRAWYNHVGVAVVALAEGAVLWLAFDQPIQGAIATGTAALIGEFSLFLQPTRALDRRDRPTARWQLAPMMGGLQVLAVW